MKDHATEESTSDLFLLFLFFDWLKICNYLRS